MPQSPPPLDLPLAEAVKSSEVAETVRCFKSSYKFVACVTYRERNAGWKIIEK